MRKGHSRQIVFQVVALILFLVILLAVMPMIVSGGESAERAATSCGGIASDLANAFGRDFGLC